MAVAIAIIAAIQFMPLIDMRTKVIATVAVVVLIIIDVVHMMANLKLDEREREHEAISERNAAWAMIAVIIGGVLWQLYTTATQGAPTIDPFLIGAIIAGTIVKMASNLYLEHKA